MRKKTYSTLVIYCVALYIFILGLRYIFTVLLGLEDHEIAQIVGSPTQSALLGIGLVYLAISLTKRLFRAWLITLSLVCVALLREIILLQSRTSLASILLLVIATVVLLFSKNQFKAKTEVVRLRGGVAVAITLLLIAIVYGSIGFTLLPSKSAFREPNLIGGFNETLREYTLTPNTSPMPLRDRRTDAFLISLRALGFASALLAGYALLQPVIYRREHQDEQHDKARKLLEKYGGNSEDFFKLWPHDKEYLFSQTADAAIAYKVANRVALSAGDPFGNPRSFKSVVSDFQAFCESHSFDMAFVHITDQHKKLYETHGLKLQKIGEEAIVDLKKYTELTSKNKKWRHVQNKFEKLGYTFELRQPPFSSTLIKELERISDSWLKVPGRTERGFVMGYFDADYVGSCDLGILRNEEQQIVSFVNIVQSYDPTEANMDMFRQRANSPTNMNDYMMSKTLSACHELGYSHFNLGLCPLVGLDSIEEKSKVSTALRLVYNFGGKLYSFKGLYQFKSKFEPAWRDRFIAYNPDPLTLTRTIQALNVAMKVRR